MDTLITGPVLGADRDRAVAFLATYGISQSIQPGDHIFVALAGTEVVGAVRLAVESGVLVLRGMRVRADVQRRGIGTRLLGRLDDAVGDMTCWCIPYGWLTTFYGQIGFRLAAIDEAPDFLAERCRQYREHGLDVTVMVRMSRGHT